MHACLTVESDESRGVLLQEGGGANDDSRRPHARGMQRGKGERVRSSSARADHVDRFQPEAIEKTHGVIGHHGDPPASQACRSPEAGSIRDDHPNPEAIVGLLVRMS